MQVSMLIFPEVIRTVSSIFKSCKPTLNVKSRLYKTSRSAILSPTAKLANLVLLTAATVKDV